MNAMVTMSNPAARRVRAVADGYLIDRRGRRSVAAQCRATSPTTSPPSTPPEPADLTSLISYPAHSALGCWSFSSLLELHHDAHADHGLTVAQIGVPETAGAAPARRFRGRQVPRTGARAGAADIACRRAV